MVPLLLGASIGMSLLGGISGAIGVNRAGNEQQRLLHEQANQELIDAKLRANVIRKLGRAQIGTTKSVAAKAGLSINSSAVSDMVDAVDSASEQDALMTLLTGERRARALRKQGDIAEAAGDNNAFGSVLGSIGSAGAMFFGGK